MMSPLTPSLVGIEPSPLKNQMVSPEMRPSAPPDANSARSSKEEESYRRFIWRVCRQLTMDPVEDVRRIANEVKKMLMNIPRTAPSSDAIDSTGCAAAFANVSDARPDIYELLCRVMRGGRDLEDPLSCSLEARLQTQSTTAPAIHSPLRRASTSPFQEEKEGVKTQRVAQRAAGGLDFAHDISRAFLDLKSNSSRITPSKIEEDSELIPSVSPMEELRNFSLQYIKAVERRKELVRDKIISASEPVRPTEDQHSALPSPIERSDEVKLTEQFAIFQTECRATTALRFHAYENFLYAADVNNRIWV